MRILILKSSSLGDVIQAVPVLRLLKLRYPDSEIYWWLSTDLIPLLEGDPDLKGIIPFDRRRWGYPRHWPDLVRSIRRMRGLRFDWIIDLQGLARSGIMAWLAKGRFSIGVDDPREYAGMFYDQHVPRPSPDTHAVDWYLAILESLRVPVHWDFAWIPVRSEVLESVRRKWQPDSARWILLNPGARWPNKRWPAEHYAELVRRLVPLYPEYRFAVLGGGADRPLGRRIAQEHSGRCLDLTGETTLSEMIEWIRLGELMITNDSGPMHAAAAMGKPVLALFGPTSPQRTGPYGQTEQVLQLPLPCVPCMRATCDYERPFECLRAMTTDQVLQRVRMRLPASEVRTADL